MILSSPEIEVDGIVSRWRGFFSQWVRPIFQLVDDHPTDAPCALCGDPEGYSSKDVYVWRGDQPIVRFTSSGLEVS